MATVIAVADETATGSTLNEFSLEFLDERVTVRELIRARVSQEVTEHNAPVRALPRSRPTRRRRTHRWRPFEGDGTLTVILSKALMLADDSTISDPTITRQIRA
ncbi:MAG: hypothetical protein QOJ59_1899 [Thermomicrobiales bacterium]|nr:hypothetical protein [Thermomicrobiales bacterium]